MKTELETLRDLMQNEEDPAIILRDFVASLGYEQIVTAFDLAYLPEGEHGDTTD